MTEYRVAFDADVTFLNGGGLQAQDFRLDVPDADITHDEVGSLFVKHLGLLMVERVSLRNVRVFPEPHKGSRGGPAGHPVPQSPRRRLVELNHVITADMTTYPGLPGPEITPHRTHAESRAHYAEGTEFAIHRISMVGNTGTYLDSPLHRYENGADLAGVPLSSVADLPAVVVRLTGSGDRGIQSPSLEAYDLRGTAVLLHTGWDRHWGTDAYDVDAPFLTKAAAELLVEAGARLVGIDSVNIDDTGAGDRPAHSALLAAGVPVLEHLTGLDRLPVTGARLHAAPPRIRAFGTFPVRAYAVVPE